MFKDFKEFILRGSVVDMAVGVIIGAAFGAIVTSLVNDVLMPPIGLLLGRVDFANLFVLLKAGDPLGPYRSLTEAQAAGAVTINYGLFVNTAISFLLVGIALFLVIRGVNRMRKEEAPEAPSTKQCPYCLSEIAIGATRCAHCTSELAPEPG
ncbi:MAG: large conductance mechanosensitive channel protein MscL [Anaerolineae bacterium]|nr:large conductance mechanosensitive channel protein MscL [Anaerolineae bacterium]